MATTTSSAPSARTALDVGSPPEGDLHACMLDLADQPAAVALEQRIGSAGSPQRPAELDARVPQRDPVTPSREHPRGFQPTCTTTDHEHVARSLAACDREIVLTAGLRVRDAVHRLLHEDVADAPVLVDARADVVGAPFGELVGQVGIREQLAPHRDEVGLARRERRLRFVGLHPPEGDDRHVDRGANGRGVLGE